MTSPSPSRSDAYDKPFEALVHGSAVVVLGVDAVAVSMTPEAVMASLDPLRRAAEQAIENRRNGVEPDLDGDV